MEERRILFAWPGPTGFMGACWRALQARGARILCLSATPAGPDSSRAFDAACDRGVDRRIIPKDGTFDREAIRAAVGEFSPDILFITGWSVPANRFLATDAAFREIPKVIQFDMPWQFRPRKFAARFVLWRYLRHFDAALVSGASAERYARWLGFGGRFPVYKGLLGTDLTRFSGQAETIRPDAFLYVGRYAPEKGLDTLLAAYRIYAGAVADPWPLDCVGDGPLRGELFPAAERRVGRGVVRDLGFRQPDELGEVFASHGAFVLPSRFEPWGVVVAEAAGAGLPIICTDACGARFELVRQEGDDSNGFVVRAGDNRALAAAMVRTHNLDKTARARMAAASLRLSAPYSAEAWAERIERIAEERSRRR